jgi:hypothetical protein
MVFLLTFDRYGWVLKEPSLVFSSVCRGACLTLWVDGFVEGCVWLCVADVQKHAKAVCLGTCTVANSRLLGHNHGSGTRGRLSKFGVVVVDEAEERNSMVILQDHGCIASSVDGGCADTYRCTASCVEPWQLCYGITSLVQSCCCLGQACGVVPWVCWCLVWDMYLWLSAFVLGGKEGVWLLMRAFLIRSFASKGSVSRVGPLPQWPQ